MPINCDLYCNTFIVRKLCGGEMKAMCELQQRQILIRSNQGNSTTAWWVQPETRDKFQFCKIHQQHTCQDSSCYCDADWCVTASEGLVDPSLSSVMDVSRMVVHHLCLMDRISSDKTFWRTDNKPDFWTEWRRFFHHQRGFCFFFSSGLQDKSDLKVNHIFLCGRLCLSALSSKVIRM